ncbi:MAG TPA: capsule assembly Wzi family protein [Pseudomonadales bacterium]|nr:capsule assembly Wzi family protein [Pseudomonadales bacterium]
MQKSNTIIVAVFAFLLFGVRAEAAPFWEPGDVQLRHDLEMVADYWHRKTLTTTWPMAVDRSLLEPNTGTPAAVRSAMSRLKRKLAESGASTHDYHAHIKLSAAKLQEPVALQTFQALPREKGELEAGLEWTGDIFAWRLNAQLENEPSDDKKGRWDGSFLGAVAGNWIVSVGALDRWWGPGWDSSLILSQNARPVPAFSISRMENEPFDLPVLNLLGAWNVVAFAGQLDSESTIPRTKLIGLRFSFAPAAGVEFGLSRTVQWGGEGQPQDAHSFIDAVIGRSNVAKYGENTNQDNSNQLAGFDMRWVSPLFDRNYALYWQLIGDDEAGYLPSQYMGLVGSEFWGQLNSGASWRLIIEHVNTHASFWNDIHDNVAYEHSTYTTGYRYFGKVLGASVDSDARAARVT